MSAKDKPEKAKKDPPKRILKIRMDKDPRMRELNCLYDNGGTPDGCHTAPFKNFKELLKHNLEHHKNGNNPCDFCGMYFANEIDLYHHTGYYMTHII